MNTPEIQKLARELFDKRLTMEYITWDQLPDGVKQIWYDIARNQMAVDAATKANP